MYNKLSEGGAVSPHQTESSQVQIPPGSEYSLELETLSPSFYVSHNLVHRSLVCGPDRPGDLLTVLLFHP